MVTVKSTLPRILVFSVESNIAGKKHTNKLDIFDGPSGRAQLTRGQLLTVRISGGGGGGGGLLRPRWPIICSVNKSPSKMECSSGINAKPVQTIITDLKPPLLSIHPATEIKTDSFACAFFVIIVFSLAPGVI